MSTNELAIADTMYLMPAMKIESVIERRNTMVKFVEAAMKKDTDFGIIPGTGSKPTLYKPGAEKLCTLFALAPRFKIIERREDWTGADHGGEPFFFYHLKCELYYRGEVFVGEADGSCNSFEKKYRYRKSERTCPVCGKTAIIKGKAEYGGGWVCFAKKDGCGAKFKDGDPVIEGQVAGQVTNPDVADQVNTILKMAQKRALVAATLIAVNASEFFTQDIEDMLIEGDYKVVSAERTEQPQTAKPAANPARTQTPAPDPDDGVSTANAFMGPDQKAEPAARPPVDVGKIPQDPFHAQHPEPAKNNGNTNGWPEPLKKIYNPEFKFQTPDHRTKVQGYVAGTLDEMAGDTLRRHTFLKALTGHDSIKEQTDAMIKALAGWVTHPRAKEEVNRIIADYLKTQGQTELPQS